MAITETDLIAKTNEAAAAKDKSGKSTIKSRQLEKQLGKEIEQVKRSLTTLTSSFKMTGSQQTRFNKGLELLSKKTPKGVKAGMKQITGVLKELR